MPVPRKPVRVRATAPDEPSLNILMVSPEAVPFAKTGGLADVAGALPLALSRLGHAVTLVLPRYRRVPSFQEIPVEPVANRTLTLGRRSIPISFVRRDLAARATAILIDAPDLYDRDGLYGVGTSDYPDNAIRFGVLARAALEYGSTVAREPFSVVHAHEWQTGLVPLHLKTAYALDANLGGRPIVFTIHNIAFQGLFPPTVLADLDLPRDLLTSDHLEYWRQVSFLKAGINFSDWITTVSPRYAKETLTPEFGFGFEGILAARRDIYSGIVNGIDVEQWNPQRDPYLPAGYSAEDFSGKLKAKAALLRAFRLPSEGAALDAPVIGMVSRLTVQKGFDLIAQALPELLKLPATFVLLGSGASEFERLWESTAAEHPERVGVKIGFDEALAHLVEAGSDMFLMPSQFEPCGLNQMYSLRYGTVPIVRAVGGLDDTVVNYNERSGRGTGFKFSEYTPQALVRTVKRALKLFRRRTEWRALQVAGLRQDFSWDASAREYVKVYRKLVQTAGRRVTKPARQASVG
jgi:starch synthase